MLAQNTSIRKLLNSDIHQLIVGVEEELEELRRHAEFYKDRFTAFTYANGPAAKRPTHEWSKLFPQIQGGGNGPTFYIYWRRNKTTIHVRGRRVRISDQLSKPKGKFKYRIESLTAKAQPWEREELLRAETDFAVIRAKVQKLATLHKLLKDIQKNA